MKLNHYLITAIICLAFSASAQANSNNEATKKEHTQPRIIALAPHIVEMLFDIGAGEQIIATSDYANYPEAAKSIPRIGNSLRIQIERVIELQPDIIIAWQSGNPSDDLARLKQLGFNIVYSQPNTFEDVAKEIRQFAALTGHTSNGEKLAKKFINDLSQIKQKYADREEISAFYEIWSRPLTTIARGSWPQQFLNICRVKNPFVDVSVQYPQTNIEQILQTQIKMIIQPLSDNQMDKTGYDWTKWTVLPAVKHNQIIQPDADVMHRMTIRSLTALAGLCQSVDKARQYYHTLTNS
jgi:vitamin B12 transport system substrate-binding protein